MADTIEDWEQAATVEARLRHELQAENERLRAALNIAKACIIAGGWNDAQRDIIEAAIEKSK